jgi:REP element-mobilizing transposase RayT
MPRKNIVKQYLPDTYYHIYSRGVNRNKIFLDDDDKTVFCSLLKRYLSDETAKNPQRRLYNNYHDEIDLITYALMSNHFHMLVYQKDDERAIVGFMRALMISYSMYFNKKYVRQGPVFQSTYLASRIDSDEYLKHISRYIHLNPSNWETAFDSSIDFYRGDRQANWVKSSPILDMFPNRESYIEFLRDYDPDEEEKLFDFEQDD